MTNRWVGKMLAVVMAVVLPASILAAETSSAMMYASKSAILNGNPVTRNSAIFTGDKVSVPAGSAVTINLAGSSVLVPSQSAITFNGDSVALEPQAAVAVTTTTGLAAQVQKIKITPANKSAKFQVGRFNGQIVVAAKEGTVLIAGLSGADKVVAEGATTSVADPEPQKPGAVPATTGAGASAGELPTWVAVLIGVAAAGAAAGIAIGTTGKPVSTVHP